MGRKMRMYRRVHLRERQKLLDVQRNADGYQPKKRKKVKAEAPAPPKW